MCRYNNKISKAAAQAFIERRPFRRDNTEVVASPSCAVLKLYGHVIGENSESRGMHLTMAGWGTLTTAARLAEFEQQRRRTYPRWLALPGLNIQPKELK